MFRNNRRHSDVRPRGCGSDGFPRVIFTATLLTGVLAQLALNEDKPATAPEHFADLWTLADRCSSLLELARGNDRAAIEASTGAYNEAWCHAPRHPRAGC